MRCILKKLILIESLLFAFSVISPLTAKSDIFYRCDHGTAHIINKISEGDQPDDKKVRPIMEYKNIGNGSDWTHYNKHGYASEETGKRFYCGGAQLEFWPHLNTGNIEGQCGAWQGESLKIKSWGKLALKSPTIYMNHCNSSFYVKKFIIDPPGGYVSISREYYGSEKKTKVSGPSFSCADVHNVADMLVCTSSELSKIDLDLDKNYQKLIGYIKNKHKLSLVAHQNIWIFKKRKCKSYSCLCKLYKQDANYINALLLRYGRRPEINYGSLFGNDFSEYRYGGCS
ncbi:hypothetical protein GL267_006125 [Acidithiobacillus ferrianus]|uniref:Lysozyme inhibitor LprI N-terminal domain-containing protein n=2 Tax=Acidithiobacillus ferrianus TaxID=2678518 RepID=A0A845U2J1_9PROT|nr:hypothetical protein [Acidithiobacillus ferrianus]NDU41832.1 hypothetical protein [Acidithiobacillus ferrianus]